MGEAEEEEETETFVWQGVKYTIISNLHNAE